MKNFTVIKTPNISLYNEKFVYNYFVTNENNISDNKFIVYNNEISNEEDPTIKPRLVTFNLDFYEEILNYNLYESIERDTEIAEVSAVNSYLDLLESLGNSPNNAFDKTKRTRYFNDIDSLKLSQVHDSEFDLTLAEDISEVYKQMVRCLDSEDPDEVLRALDHIDFINFSNKNLLQNDNEDLAFFNLKKSLKLGDFSVIKKTNFREIKISNFKNTETFLEDKQLESFSNLRDANFETNDALQSPRQPAPVAVLNAEDSFNASARRSLYYLEELFAKSPDLMVQTADFLEDVGAYGDYRNLNAFAIGILIDKFRINDENQKEYLCSKFYRLSPTLLTIQDEAVNYGKTYLYEARPVILQSYVGGGGSPKRNYYLLLGSRSSSYAIKCIERETPNPPAYLELSYDNNYKGNRLSWCLPSNRQRDIVNFQIFRRESVYEPFKLIKEERTLNIDVVDNSNEGFETPNTNNINFNKYMKFSYLDKEIQNNKIYIYAICCVDAHGLSSAYSAQVACRFNRLTSQLEVDTISLAGALKQYPNQFLPRKTRFFNFENDVISNTPIIKNKNKMNVYFTPDYQNIIKNDESIPIFSLNENNDEIENYFSISLTNLDTLKTAKQHIYIQDREE